MNAMKPNRWILGGLALVAASAPAQDFANTPVALLVTEAKLAEYGRGKVLGYFPKAELSRDPVRRTRGFFVFDNDEQRFERSQIPMQIEFRRASKEFDPQKKELRPVRDAASTFSVATDAFLGKLATLLSAENVTLPANLVPTAPFDKLETFTETTSRRWYLRPAKDARKDAFDPDVPHSVVAVLGERNAIEKLRESFTKHPETAGVALYRHSYVDQPVTLALYKLRSGGKATYVRNVEGIHFVRHRDVTAPGGRIVVPRGETEAAWNVTVPALELKTDEARITVEASVLLRNLVAPALRGDAKEDPELECVVPDEGDTPSPCSLPKGGAMRVQGTIAPDRPLKFIVEKKVEGSAADAFRAMYRVEVHFGATVSKKDGAVPPPVPKKENP